MSFFKKDELKNLWPFYLDSILSPMLFFAPAFYIVYFLSLDFSLFQISLIMSISYLATFIFEIPTGAIADIYGRKFSVLLGYLIEGLAFVSLFFVENFYYSLFAFALIGFGATFSSGAKEAWVIDLVKRKKGLDEEYFVKTQSFDSFGLVISGILGAFVVGIFGLKSIWLIAFFSYVVSIFILLFADEIFTRKKVKISNSYKNIKNQSKISLSYSKKHPVLFWYFVAGFILVFAAGFNEGLTWTPLLVDLGFPDYAFGYLWSAMSGLFILSPWVSKIIIKKHTEKNQRNFIAGSLIVTSLILFLVFFANNLIIALPISVLSLFVFTSRHPVMRSYFHRFIPTKLRATIGSVESMVLNLAAIIALPIVGLLVDLIGPKITIFIGGVLLLPAAIIYYKIKDFDKNEK